MTPSEELRAAAAKLRARLAELEEQGTDTPTWYYEHDEDPDAYPWKVSARPLNAAGRPYSIHIGSGVTPQVCQYIALMHPGVGTFLADWLEAVAKFWDGLNQDADEWTKLPPKIRDGLRSGPWDAEHALAIARSINGTPTPEAS